jgi:diacylglycerol kinase
VNKPFSFNHRLVSFRHAFAGIATLLREQHNSRIHLAATVAVVAAGVYLDVSRVDWLALLVAIALVWMAEAFNSAVEYLSDAAVPEQHPLIRKAKDVAAAGVLVASINAAAIGAIVFLAYL